MRDDVCLIDCVTCTSGGSQRDVEPVQQPRLDVQAPDEQAPLEKLQLDVIYRLADSSQEPPYEPGGAPLPDEEPGQPVCHRNPHNSHNQGSVVLHGGG